MMNSRFNFGSLIALAAMGAASSMQTSGMRRTSLAPVGGRFGYHRATHMTTTNTAAQQKRTAAKKRNVKRHRAACR
jgi:hypothetical protein